MITQLITCYDITNKEKLAIKSHFLVPWSDIPEAHVTTFARQLETHQVQCKYHGVIVTYNYKVEHFVVHMYAYGLFESKFLD